MHAYPRPHHRLTLLAIVRACILIPVFLMAGWTDCGFPVQLRQRFCAKINCGSEQQNCFPNSRTGGQSATPDDGRDPSNRKHMDSGQLVYASIREPLVVILYSHTRSTYSATLGGVPGATGGHGSNQPRHHRTISVPTRTPQACRR